VFADSLNKNYLVKISKILYFKKHLMNKNLYFYINNLNFKYMNNNLN
jgi:hypothetical protein